MEIRMISKIEEMEMPVEDVFVISDKKEFLDVLILMEISIG